MARNVWPTGRKLAGRTKSRWLSDCSVLTARPASGLRLQLKASSESPAWAQAAQARNVRHKATSLPRVSCGECTVGGRCGDGVGLAGDDQPLGGAERDEGHRPLGDGKVLRARVLLTRERIGDRHAHAVLHAYRRIPPPNAAHTLVSSIERRVRLVSLPLGSDARLIVAVEVVMPDREPASAPSGEDHA